MFFGKITVINRLHRRASHSSTSPRLKIQSRRNAGRPSSTVPLKLRIAPRAGAVINAHGLVRLDRAGVRLGGRQFDFAHGHADVGVDFAGNINAFAAGSRSADSLLCGSNESLVAIIKCVTSVESRGDRLIRKGGGKSGGRYSYASITWIRFLGRRRSRVALSAFVPQQTGPVGSPNRWKARLLRAQRQAGENPGGGVVR